MISALIPYRPDGGHRDAAWSWIRQRWADLLPDVELVLATDDGGDNPGHFNHPLAINRAAARATGDILVVADADTAFDPDWIRQAANLVTTGTPWVLPRYYRKITESDTELALSRSHRWRYLDQFDTEWIGDEVANSGLVVVPREGFEAVGGYEERITHWGFDDAIFRIVMDTLWGPVHRLDGSAYHLWHPAPLGETYGHEHHRRQHALGKRYAAAAGDPDAVRSIIAEDEDEAAA